MATVPLTKGRQDSLLSKVRSFYSPRIEIRIEKMKAIRDKYRDKMAQKMLDDPMISAMEEFEAKHGKAFFRYKSFKLIIQRSDNAVGKQYYYDLELPSPVLVSFANLDTQHSWSRPVPNPITIVYPELFDELKEQDDAKEKVEAERDSQLAAINDVFEQVNTLKQLLEVWPEARELVPNEDLEQMHRKPNVEKVNRERVKTAAVQIDKEKLTGAILASKPLTDNGD